MIHKEHYRDFIGTLSVKIEEIDAETNKLDLSDSAEWLEYDSLRNTLECYETAQKYFSDPCRWANFDNISSLESYVDSIINCFKSMDKHSESMSPVWGLGLIGATQEEWEVFESMRYEFSKKLTSWKLFLEFCKTGKIE